MPPSQEKSSNSDSALARLKSKVELREEITSDDLDSLEEDGHAAILRAEASGMNKLHTLRGHWSFYLMSLLSVTTIFQVAFIVLVGCNILPFTDNKVFVNSVAGELFLQIAGMGYVVVRCLFSSNEMDRTKKLIKQKEVEKVKKTK